MRIDFTKGADRDLIDIVRDDGSKVSTSFPKKGWFPHDAVHLVIEGEMGLENGFWGHVAAGHAPEDVGAIAKQGGHASATRAASPDPAIHQLLQAERLVECFEAELWGETAPLETFLSVVAAACAQSQVPLPDITEEDVARIRARLEGQGREWRALPVGATLQLAWP